MSMKILTLALSAIVVFGVAAEIPAQTKKRPIRKSTAKKASPPPEIPIDVPMSVVFNSGPTDADGWNLYESKADSFKLSFPPTPVVTDESDADGKKSGNRYYNAEPVTPARINLTAVVLDLGTKIESDEQKSELYKVWMGSLVGQDRAGAQGVKMSDKEFAIPGGFGVEVVVDRGDYRFHGRAICIGNKFYQLGVGSLVPAAGTSQQYVDTTKWVRKFFDSFQYVAKPAPPPNPLYGKLVNGVYENTVGGFSLTVPTGWISDNVQTDDDGKSERIKEMFRTGDKANNKKLEDAIDAEKTVLRMLQGPGGTPRNHILGVGLLKAPRTGTSVDANTLVTRRAFESSAMKPKIGPTTSKFVGKVKMTSFDMVTDYNGVVIKQRLYFALNKGYAVTFVIAYWDEETLQEIERSMATLKFQ